DSRDPDARAHALEDQVARNLEHEVAEEEEARADAIRRVAQSEVPLEIHGGEPDVEAVHVRDDVTDEGERDEPAYDPRDNGVGIGIRLWALGFRRDRIGRQLLQVQHLSSSSIAPKAQSPESKAAAASTRRRRAVADRADWRRAAPRAAARPACSATQRDAGTGGWRS